MMWLQLEVETTQDYVDQLSIFFEEVGAVSVSISASSSEPIFDECNNDENAFWDKTKITVLLSAACNIDNLIAQLDKFANGKAIQDCRIEPLEDKDWIDEFKSKYQPMIFLEKICISPSWCAPLKSKIPTIIVDPGLAFGTGAHPTTSLCIEWFCMNNIENKIVIDYGCGSGILSMVAAKLGARKVYAVDNDETALEITQENIKNNKLGKIVSTVDTENLSIPKADILVANILLNPLMKLYGEFSRLTKKNSHIILSGVLNEQAEKCLATYRDNFNMDKPVLKKSWVSLHGVRL